MAASRLVAQATEELYGLPPGEFTRARDERAKQLRKDGDRDAAGAVKALRKPTVAAWAVNQLARRRRADLDRLLAAGEQLRAAQEELLSGGDRSAFQSAAAEERELVAKLSADAAALASEAGERAGGLQEKLAETLHAAALDEETAGELRAGRLVREREAIGGFGALSAEPTGGRRSRDQAAGAGKGAAREEARGKSAARPEARGTGAARPEARGTGAARPEARGTGAARDQTRGKGPTGDGARGKPAAAAGKRAAAPGRPAAAGRRGDTSRSRRDAASRKEAERRQRLAAATTDERHARRELESAERALEHAQTRAEAAEAHAREANERARTTAERLKEAKRAVTSARRAHGRAERALEKAQSAPAGKS